MFYESRVKHRSDGNDITSNPNGGLTISITD